MNTTTTRSEAALKAWETRRCNYRAAMFVNAGAQLVATFPRSEKYGKGYVKVSNRPGVLAFRNDTVDSYGRRLRSEKLVVGGRTFKLVSFNGGEWECYRIESDNFTETFVGYARDVMGRLAKGGA